MKKLIFLSLILLSSNLLSKAQNGYSLEFEDVMTLSVESVIGQTYAAGATGSKTYTVPANMVLKITGGCIYNAASGAASYSTLSVGSEVISFNRQNAGSLTWVPIWASSGTVITLTYKNNSTTTAYGLECGYITGVLFRKVAN